MRPRSAILLMSLLSGCADGGASWGHDAPVTGVFPDAPRQRDAGGPDAFDEFGELPAVFQCPALSAVAGLDAEGKATCAPTGPDGIVPAFDAAAADYACPARYGRQMLHYETGSTNNVNFYACFLDRSGSEGSDPAYRHPSLGALACPLGAVLRGFTSDGTALCRADGSVPVDYALTPFWDGNWTANSYTCPPGYERNSEHYDCNCSDNATWPTCVRTAAADVDVEIPGTGAQGAVARLCAGEGVVIGFADDGSPVCSAAAVGVPVGFGFYPRWGGGAGFICPDSELRASLHYECDCTDNGIWYGCYVR